LVKAALAMKPIYRKMLYLLIAVRNLVKGILRMTLPNSYVTASEKHYPEIPMPMPMPQTQLQRCVSSFKGTMDGEEQLLQRCYWTRSSGASRNSCSSGCASVAALEPHGSGEDHCYFQMPTATLGLHQKTQRKPLDI
jgi:hypothetical protein